MSGLPREILKWIQSLDLTHTVRNTRRDFSNGYLVAEIFSWYFPQEVTMHSYENGTSLKTKLGNWEQLQRFFLNQGFDIPKDIVEGTIHCKPRAAAMLIEKVYTILTNRSVKVTVIEDEPDFSDRRYQTQLPAHARSTASMAIKNNLANTELVTDPDRILCQQKAQSIINNHIEHRRQERTDDPKRFGIRPTLGELCPRLAPRQNIDHKKYKDKEELVNQMLEEDSSMTKDPSQQFTEIQVNQLPGNNMYPSMHNSAFYSTVR
ncbi:spermatogenesis-associated protein 4-like [Actinia tenebrosa]|uniref:Spermatogenesis-associated protein 4 n=1 Tax=Actinia tenebrosa TaxID=6105 RepID=A0A6P8ISP3_ACTTE|nr:spermatogenesis-associated protein 4-like [Actinia tenebrosa]